MPIFSVFHGLLDSIKQSIHFFQYVGQNWTKSEKYTKFLSRYSDKWPIYIILENFISKNLSAVVQFKIFSPFFEKKYFSQTCAMRMKTRCKLGRHKHHFSHFKKSTEPVD